MSGVVLVTGAAGFVGSHLIHALASSHSASDSIVAWRRAARSGRPISGHPPRDYGNHADVHWQEVDILQADDVRAAVDAAAPSSIYHCAGVASVCDSWDDTRTPLEGNVKGTDNLLQAVVSSGLSTKILIPGSALVYRPASRALREDGPIGPLSPYGLSKLAQEMLARRYAEEGLPVLSTRSFTHVGPGQSVSYAASSFAYQIAQIEAGHTPPLIRVGNLDAQRDITDVRDTVSAYLALMGQGLPGRIYNVCSGQAHRIADVLEILLTQASVPISIEIDELRLRPSDNPVLMGDPSRIRQDTGWRPRIPLRQTLEDLLDYWRHTIASQGQRQP